MPALSILIKPASSLCDLRCKYCFYADVTDHRNVKSYGIMEEGTVDALIKRAFDYADPAVTFAFQGGEPTLIGLDYFKSFVSLVKHNNTKSIRINYAIQTNGTLLDDDFCAFFKENNFLVGLSMDGPKEVHDLNRLDPKRKGTFKDVDKAAKLLDKHKVDFNILTVVTKGTCRHITKIYNYFKKQGYRYLQFIPCINDFNDTTMKPYSITPDDYGKFLVDLFDLWYKDFMSGYTVSIRTFDNYVQMLLGLPPESCDMNGYCSVNPVIESDGSVYPCDFYVLDEWRLGNINTSTFGDLMQNDTAKKFLTSGKNVPDKCRSCDYFGLCRSGCRRHKEMEQDSLITNYFCESYIYFFDRTYDRLKQMASIVARNYK